jgi:hypothetical protein
MARVAAPKGIVVKHFSASAMAGVLHHHGCVQCRLRYEDPCEQPEIDSLCNSCICGRVQAYQAAIEPQECCRVLCTRATDKERITYKLAGPGPWFICARCRRQHPFNPSGGSQ